MKKLYNAVYIISDILFAGGIILGLVGRVICTRDNKDYGELQPELFLPDVIETVLHDEELKQLYVCYNDANYVNVYSESGEFLWAVATPYIRNTYFELQDDKLMIYGDGAYVYSSANGDFLGLAAEENLDLSYNWQKEHADDLQNGEFCFDSHQVYKADSDGSLHTVIARPWWYRVFDFGTCLIVAAFGAVGFGLTHFYTAKKSYDSVKKKTVFKNRKAKIIKNYFIVISIIQLLYAVIDIVGGFFGGIFCIGIFPIAIYFIISNIVTLNILDRISVSREEMQVLKYWETVEIITFVTAFLSVILAAGIAG